MKAQTEVGKPNFSLYFYPDSFLLPVAIPDIAFHFFSPIFSCHFVLFVAVKNRKTRFILN